ncbi:MAG: N-acetylneuraminate synthase family protein [Chitinophagales bacterium]|jgi:N,N'-diacetyllegionaminate synthase
MKEHSKKIIIAEIGQAHDGSLGIAHSYIDALAETGVNAIKFQTHIAEAESSDYEEFRVNFSFQDATRYDYWKRMEFSLDQWSGLKRHCDDVGVEFISSPFSCAAVDLLTKIGVNKFKIGSGEVNNKLIIDKICQTNKEIYISSGMSSYNELDQAIKWISVYGNKVSLFQCTTNYPTIPSQWGLNVINEMRDRYSVPIGFSDHSGDIFAGLSAVTLGADLLEFHVVFDKKMFGPDTKSSITIDMTKQLVAGVRNIEKALENKIDKNEDSHFIGMKINFGKSLCVNKNLKKGDILSFDDLEAKKPGNKGISADMYDLVLGKSIKRNLTKWEFLNNEDIL